MTVEPTCPGRCCAVFYFPHTPAEVEAYREKQVRFVEFEYIADMLIPLTIAEGRIRFRELGYGELEDTPGFATGIDPEVHEGHLYTCRHWDAETRLCTAYESRPLMCREYPYAGTCTHGCGYEAPAETRRKWLSGRRFDWSTWRWSAAAGGYRKRRGAEPPSDGWDPGAGWSWDGTTLIPIASADWDRRAHKWRIVPVPEEGVTDVSDVRM